MSPTNFGMDIFKVAVKLFKEHWNGEPVRSAGVSLSQLEPCDYVQLSLFDAQEKDQSRQSIDDIHERYAFCVAPPCRFTDRGRPSLSPG